MKRSIAALALAAILGIEFAEPSAKAAAPATDAKAALSPGATAIEKAARDKKYLFIFFWRDETQQSRTAREAFQAATKKLAGEADTVEIRITDPLEKEIVNRYGVSRAPMPFVLSIAPNGAMTKGLSGRLNEKQLREAFVSPCTAECMKSLQQRKLVLLCIYREKPSTGEAALPQGVKDFTADEQYAKNSAVVTLVSSDPAEASFLKNLPLDAKMADPVTVLIAPPAAALASFPGKVTKEQLVDTLKSAQSGCCPGGTCGPNGCGPKQ